MTPRAPGTWLEFLSADECWDLLAGEVVGRIGVLVDGAPEVYPVNHVVDGGTIVFRTDPGNKLRGLALSPHVCFEADGIDVDQRTGWSVLVKGRAEEISDPEALGRWEALELELWSIGEKAHWVRIAPREVTGRRIARVAADAPWRR